MACSRAARTQTARPAWRMHNSNPYRHIRCPFTRFVSVPHCAAGVEGSRQEPNTQERGFCIHCTNLILAAAYRSPALFIYLDIERETQSQQIATCFPELRISKRNYVTERLI